MTSLEKILYKGTLGEKKALFQFDAASTDEEVRVKYNLWARFFFPQYFKSPDAPFHKEMDLNLIRLYRRKVKYFLNSAFRGAAKTSRAKLFFAFAIANDTDTSMRYLRILCEDGNNSKQIVTDIYNMLVFPRVCEMYPEVFQRTESKREETMTGFTTSTKIKVTAGTVGTDQRGALQEDARPDMIWFEDFENRKTLWSARTTKAIWDNMEEARTGLSSDGVCLYTFNYLSEAGNSHKLVLKPMADKVWMNTAITTNGTATGQSSWPERYSKEDIANMVKDDDDFEGERLCRPSASKDIFFDRERLDTMRAVQPKRVSAGFKIFEEYNPSHRYGSGHDVAGGVGLDSSTSVFIDFSTVPARVAATFNSNQIKPDVFGYEIDRETEMYGDNLAAPETNNHGHATIAIAKQLEVNLYATEGKATNANPTAPRTYGWHTNALTKPKMFSALAKALNDGLLELCDEDLINEAKGYTRNDLIETEPDPRLTTRHFDLLTACAIAWQMKDYAEAAGKEEDEVDNEMRLVMRRNRDQSLIAR